jgi:SAM-dependent methyltransferase
MSDGWVWDDMIFAGAAEHYERGRLPYAPGLADAFTEVLGADGTGRLLDVGCGPGTIALRLAKRYRDVVGIDSDAGMIGAAERLARERNVVNATFVRGRAEALPMGCGTFDTITFGASFHWMLREQVSLTVRGMLVDGGAVVHVDTDRGEVDMTSDRFPPPPQAAVRRLVAEYLGEGRRAGRSVGFVSPWGEDDIWRAAGFDGPASTRVPDGRVLGRTIDDVVAGTLSMSYSAPHLFGPRLAAFEADLRALLGVVAVGGFFNVHVPDTLLKVWRPTPDVRPTPMKDQP